MIKKDNKENKNIAVFGGSFDPVHKCHTEIVKNLCGTFDKTIVVPSFVSPFKESGAAADSKHRINMLKNAFENLSNVEICEYEIKKNDVSFTVDTINYLASKNSGAKLYFVIGTDLLKDLPKWKKFNELKKLVTFYIIKRSNFRADKDRLNKLTKKGVSFEFADFSMPDISSSLAKVSVAFSFADVVGEKNYEYIKQNALYTDFNYIVDAYEKFNLKQERIEHTYRAAIAAIALAKKYKADLNKTITAMLLHDIGKYATEEVLRANNLEMSAKLNSFPHQIAHAYVSAYIAKNYFNIKDSSILKAIESHTTGSLKMTKLAKIVFLADYIEEGRKFNNLESIKKECDISLDFGMEAALKNSIEFLNESGREIYYPTIQVYERFVEINNLKLEKEAEKLAKKEEKEAQKNKAETANTKPSEGASKSVSEKIDAPYDLAYTIAQCASNKKGRDIVLVDLSQKTIIADYFVIISATSSTAVRALTDYIDEQLSKNYFIEPLRRDIDKNWAAVDYGSVIVHVQLDETRKFYDLERLWSDGTNVKRVY